MNEHGDFTITTDGQVITVVAIDDWNIQTTLRFCHEFRLAVEKIRLNDWILVADLSKWGLGTPDIWEEFHTLTQWAIDNNKTHEIVIYSLSIQKDMLEKMQKNLSVKSHFCINNQEAEIYLKQILPKLH